MHIRTFQAPTLQEALAEIRRQMGSDAVVLHTRDVSRGLMGVFGKTQVEVTAGLKPQQSTTNNTGSIKPVSNKPAAAKPQDNQLAANNSPDKSANKSAIQRSSQRIEQSEIQRLRQQVDRLSQVVQSWQSQQESLPGRSSNAQSPRLPDGSTAAIAAKVPHQPQTQRVIEALKVYGIAEDTALWINSRVKLDDGLSDDELLPVLRQTLRKQFRTTGPIAVPLRQQRVVALVGPTGVGKTTTIAKLAAGFRLQEKRKVGLITIDTFRIAAVDQLHKYAQVMELPMEVVHNGQQMQDAMRRLADMDLVLIDTVGRSPRDVKQIELTGNLLRYASPQEIHLVMSATSSRSTIDSTVNNYAMLAPTALILTKLDEVVSQPEVLCLSDARVPPLSYVTTGQSVPDDIDLAQPSMLMELAFALGEQAGQGRAGEPKVLPEPDAPTLANAAIGEKILPKDTHSRNLLLPSK